MTVWVTTDAELRAALRDLFVKHVGVEPTKRDMRRMVDAWHRDQYEFEQRLLYGDPNAPAPTGILGVSPISAALGRAVPRGVPERSE